MGFIYSSVSQADEIEEIKIILKHCHFLLAECLQNFLSPTFSQSHFQTPVIPKTPATSSFSVTPSGHKWAYFRRNIKYFIDTLMHSTNIYWWPIICQADDLMTKKEKNSPSPRVDCQTGKADNFRQKWQ